MQTKRVNVFDQTPRKILCIANKHDYLGNGTVFKEDLIIGQLYSFESGEMKSYGLMAHLKEKPSKYGYQAYLFAEIESYDDEIFEKAYEEHFLADLEIPTKEQSKEKKL